MRGRDRSSVMLLTGLWGSLGFHTLVGMGFVRYSDVFALNRQARSVAPPRAPEPLLEQPKDKKPPTVKLGIARSDAATMTWLGYEKPTEHQAMRGKTEQSEMARAAPGPVGAATPSAPA